MLHSACSIKYFPLTPCLRRSRRGRQVTLSLRERGQQASDPCLTDSRWLNTGTGVIERRRIILPLPRGEGRGEGEPRVANPGPINKSRLISELAARRIGSIFESGYALYSPNRT